MHCSKAITNYKNAGSCVLRSHACTYCTVGWEGVAGGHWGKIEILEFQFLTWRYWKYRLYGSQKWFNFLSTPKYVLSRAFWSWSNLPLLTFLLKNGQHFKLKYKIWTCAREAIFTKLVVEQNYILKMLWPEFCKNLSRANPQISSFDVKFWPFFSENVKKC